MEGCAAEFRTALVAAEGAARWAGLAAHAAGTEVQVVVAEGEHRAVEREAAQRLRAGAAVFAQDEAAARAPGDVVGIVEHGAAGRFVHQAKGFLARIVGEDLALAGGAAAGGTDVDETVSVPGAFAAHDAGSALHQALRDHAAVLRAGDERLVRVLDVDPFHIPGRTRWLADAGVVVGVAGAGPGDAGIGRSHQFHHLQAPAERGPAADVGDEAVEAGGRAVLGFVDVAGHGVDGDGFVAEAAHVAQRHRLGGAGGGHVEAVAVLLGVVAVGVQAVGGFLAGDPGVPGRGAAGAVADRAGDRGPARQPFLLFGGEHEVGRAAVALRIVGQAGGCEGAGRAALFVVAHQHELVGVGSDHGHAVVQARGGYAIAHHVAGPAEGPVAEALRQLQQRQAGRFVGHRGERTVVGAVGQRHGVGATGTDNAERHGDGGGRGDAAFQEAAAAECPVGIEGFLFGGLGQVADEIEMFVTGGHASAPVR